MAAGQSADAWRCLGHRLPPPPPPPSAIRPASAGGPGRKLAPTLLNPWPWWSGRGKGRQAGAADLYRGPAAGFLIARLMACLMSAPARTVRPIHEIKIGYAHILGGGRPRHSSAFRSPPRPAWLAAGATLWSRCQAATSLPPAGHPFYFHLLSCHYFIFVLL